MKKIKINVVKTCFFLLVATMPFCSFGMLKKEEFETVELDKSEKICAVITKGINKIEQAWERSEANYRKAKFRLNVAFYSSLALMIGFTVRYIKNKINEISLNDDQYGLFVAVHTNNSDEVENFAHKITAIHKVSLDEPCNGYYFLQNAVRFSGYDCIKELLEKKASPNIRDKENKTALCRAVGRAIKNGDSFRLVQLLLDYDADCRNIDGQGNNIFHRAALKNPDRLHDFLDLKRSLEKENKFIKIFLLCMKDKDKTLHFKIPRPLLFKILSYLGISNKPYPRSSIAHTGLLFEKNRDGKTPYDILIEKNSPHAEKLKPLELSLEYVSKTQYVPKTYPIEFYPKIKLVD